ncbi:hypothetical protein SAMN05421739_10754 [Pontibacter chinhatensis]|uniref:Uncharacterized protein n=1 Tax=Pontibacter chinhatensis TaxID=1436961 RepID=A0A1I2Y344_9BACT|nr:hypothetical protein SAMN05421739_10754 [Pontibacter chinhatensis]
MPKQRIKSQAIDLGNIILCERNLYLFLLLLHLLAAKDQQAQG